MILNPNICILLNILSNVSYTPSGPYMHVLCRIVICDGIGTQITTIFSMINYISCTKRAD